MERAHPNHDLISSEQVQGTDVRGVSGDKIGTIDHLMVDKPSGKIAYAVMSFGGFLGVGHSHYPIPWGMLRYNVGQKAYEASITEAQLKDAPQFSDNAWTSRDWETKTHKHYGTPPYWGM